ncbi:MAG TPA: sigma-70 family RNA polymerase sigma factor, partial [Solirubrobacterales bacterium]|nr:sigma-70 family RNA polymerase sigma factor [Solirubrobacterales bacterium]
MTEIRALPEDVQLVRELVQGSEQALAALYDRYGEAIFAAAHRLTADRGIAEEVVQETFLTLWNRAELFDPTAGSLAAWLHAIGRNRAVDRLRAAGRRPHLVGVISPSADESDSQALERVMASGTVVAGASQPP